MAARSKSPSPNQTPSFKLNPGQERLHALLTQAQRHTLGVGGARSGKTFLFVRALVTRAIVAPESRHVMLRFRANAARTSLALDTLPKVMRLCFPTVPLTEHRQDGYFELPNASQIWIGGLDDKERVEKILGTEFATIYFNECSQIPYSSVTVARTRLAQICVSQATGKPLAQRAYYDLNPAGTGHWTYREFIEHRDPLSGRPLARPDDFRMAYLNPGDNSANLTPEFLAELQALPEKQRRRFFDGQYVAEVDGALWTYEQIEACRLGDDEKPPAFRKVVVAVDPSGAAGKEDERSDEIGIVVVGLGMDGICYVLADYSLRDKPEKWGRTAVNAFHNHQADHIVAEQNFGGDMVRFVLKAADANVPVKVISAARGKHVRAEPVAALYEQKKVRHVGRFPDMEDQMVNFSGAGYMGERSPDRADAMVWAVTDLVLGVSTTGILDYYAELAQKAARERGEIQ